MWMKIKEKTEITDSLKIEVWILNMVLSLTEKRKKNKKRKPGLLIGVCVFLRGRKGDRSRDAFYVWTL